MVQVRVRVRVRARVMVRTMVMVRVTGSHCYWIGLSKTRRAKTELRLVHNGRHTI